MTAADPAATPIPGTASVPPGSSPPSSDLVAHRAGAARRLHHRRAHRGRRDRGLPRGPAVRRGAGRGRPLARRPPAPGGRAARRRRSRSAGTWASRWRSSSGPGWCWTPGPPAPNRASRGGSCCSRSRSGSAWWSGSTRSACTNSACTRSTRRSACSTRLLPRGPRAEPRPSARRRRVLGTRPSASALVTVTRYTTDGSAEIAGRQHRPGAGPPGRAAACVPARPRGPRPAGAQPAGRQEHPGHAGQPAGPAAAGLASAGPAQGGLTSAGPAGRAAEPAARPGGGPPGRRWAGRCAAEPPFAGISQRGTARAGPLPPRRPAFRAAPGVLAVPADVSARAAAVGHHAAGRLPGPAHPAGLYPRRPHGRVSQPLLVSHCHAHLRASIGRQPRSPGRTARVSPGNSAGSTTDLRQSGTTETSRSMPATG